MRLYLFLYIYIKLYRDILFNVAEKRPSTINKVLVITQGVKMFTKWALRTNLF